jgi:reactive intermediate/imine deaminase
MLSEIVENESASPVGGHYSASCTANGFVYISGQLPITHTGEVLAQETFAVQVNQVLVNLDACLEGAGVSRERLVNVRVYITDMALWPEFNRMYSEWIGRNRPSRAVAGVAELHYGSALEVEAVAAI